MPNSINEAAADAIIANLTQEFLMDAVDRLGELGILVEKAISGQVDSVAAMADIRRETHTLKGMGGSYGFPAISVIAHRLENYLADLDIITIRQFEDVLRFFDRMQDIADSGKNPDDETLSRIVRALPAKGGAEEDFQAVGDREFLLVAGSRIVGRAVERGLYKRGYRVVTVNSPIEVFEHAVRAKPDMIIASAVMDRISGIDLAKALGAMVVTRDIPFVLLTSFDAAHPELRQLPGDVMLLHHDQDVDAEISKVIERFG